MVRVTRITYYDVSSIIRITSDFPFGRFKDSLLTLSHCACSKIFQSTIKTMAENFYGSPVRDSSSHDLDYDVDEHEEIAQSATKRREVGCLRFKFNPRSGNSLFHRYHLLLGPNRFLDCLKMHCGMPALRNGSMLAMSL